MGFAITFFHPRCHKPDRNASRMGFRLVKIRKQGKTLQITPGRKDDLDLADIGCIENVLRACPETADVFCFINPGIWCV